MQRDLRTAITHQDTQRQRMFLFRIETQADHFRPGAFPAPACPQILDRHKTRDRQIGNVIGHAIPVGQEKPDAQGRDKKEKNKNRTDIQRRKESQHRENNAIDNIIDIDKAQDV